LTDRSWGFPPDFSALPEPPVEDRLPPGTVQADVIDAYRRLYPRLKLVGTSGGRLVPPHLLPGIRLTTSLDDLLVAYKVVTAQVSPTADGWITVLTVPADKRWRAHTVTYVKDAGTYSYNALRLTDVSLARNLTLDSFTAENSTRYFPNSAHPVPVLPMDAGDHLDLSITTWSVTGALTMTALVTEEDSY